MIIGLAALRQFIWNMGVATVFRDREKNIGKVLEKMHKSILDLF